MTWQIMLVLLIIVNSGHICLNKLLANKLKQNKIAVGVFYQYFFCASFSILWWLFFSSGGLNLKAATIGLVMSVGNYFCWRARELSLSKTAFLNPLIYVISILLAGLFLREIELWNTYLLLGALFCFFAIWFFIPKNEEEKRKSKRWLLFALMFVSIAGFALFVKKSFSLTLPIANFFASWFSGALIGSLAVFIFTKQRTIKLSKNSTLKLFALGLTTLATQTALYLTYQSGGAVTVVTPIWGFFTAAITALLGLFIFKEKQNLSTKNIILGLLVGLSGAILISFGLR